MANYELLYLTGGYLMAFCLAIFFINFLTQGFVIVYLRVKAGRGRKILAKVYSVTGIYWAIGVLEGADMVYTPRNEKNKKRIPLARADLNRMFNVPMVEVDEETNAIKRPDFTSVSSFDAQKSDIMVQKAILLPKLDNGNLMIAVVIILVIVLLVVFYLVYGQVKIKESIAAINVVTGGVI